jgi:transcriptional regulator of acetoin/glycerol metabolism
LSWDLSPQIRERSSSDESEPERRPYSERTIRTMEEVEKEKIMEALESTKGNITRSADLLGFKSRQTMLNKMDAYGIARNYGDLRE